MPQPFIKNHWQNPSNRRYLLTALLLIIFEWTIFKGFYPYPNLSLDSYFYTKAALLHKDSNVWPIGYSMYMRLGTSISHSPLFFVTLQFLIFEIACLVFFFTWREIFQPGRWSSRIFFALLFINPLLLVVCNFILSDSIFIAISLLWISQLLWIIQTPRPWMILSHTILVVLAFTVRYNALYYPPVFSIAFLLGRFSWPLKALGISIPLLFLGLFIVHTSQQSIAISGQPQFSPFGSWHLANNALYGYQHIYPEKANPLDPAMKSLDDTVYRFFSQQQKLIEINDQSFSGAFFMWSGRSPLMIFMKDPGPGFSFLGAKRWMEVAPLYQQYGNYLIKKYPVTFARYWLWPNFLQYWIPPQDMAVTQSSFYLNNYLGGNFARQLFGLTTISVPQKYITWRKTIVDLYPLLFAFIHLTFILGSIAFLSTRNYIAVPKRTNWSLLTIWFLWLVDMGFIVFSTGIWVRYMVFIMIIELATGIYLLDLVYRKLVEKEKAQGLPTTVLATGIEP